MGVLGWTGIDPAHHLNVMTSTDGVHFGNKLTLDETSFVRPAVALVGGKVAVAWTGNDANHSLNILYDVYGAQPRKLTLFDENSFTAPAVGVAFSAQNPPSLLVLGWTGTDSNHSLNLRLFTFPALERVNKTIAPASFNSVAGPAFAFNGRLFNAQAPVMTWAAQAPPQRVADTFLDWTGTQWTGLESPTFVDDELSASNPGFVAPSTTSFPVTVAWTGIDPAHKVNLIFNVGFQGAEKFTLTDTALGGPALGEVERANQSALAWTGTDEAHHLNIATITV